MILLAGATSSPGRRVLDSLLSGGHAVRVLVRGERDARELAERGAEVLRGDVRDRAIVETACRGAEIVISLLGRHFAETQEGLWAIDAEANRALVVQARAAGVRRFVLLLVALARRLRKREFGVYELLLFTEMLCDHGYACDPAPARALLGREPISLETELREYYATVKLTPWRDTNFGALRNRSR
jgi:nucleoside-diphosphate-sugar epimerase